MRASYDSIDNKLKQKMCGKVNKDITFIYKQAKVMCIPSAGLISFLPSVGCCN